MRRVCVFCGASPGNRSLYGDGARSLGRALVDAKLGLVFGGGSIGMMGIIADEVIAAGGEVIGVIPEALDKRELGHKGVTELHVVDSMHTRKAKMAELSDAFIAMPGGLGTLEEFFEVLTWAQLGIHRKPCGLLNIGGYFDHLIALFDHIIDQAFADPRDRQLVVHASDPAAMLQKLATYDPPNVKTWLAGKDT